MKHLPGTESLPEITLKEQYELSCIPLALNIIYDGDRHPYSRLTQICEIVDEFQHFNIGGLNTLSSLRKHISQTNKKIHTRDSDRTIIKRLQQLFDETFIEFRKLISKIDDTNIYSSNQYIHPTKEFIATIQKYVIVHETELVYNTKVQKSISEILRGSDT